MTGQSQDESPEKTINIDEAISKLYKVPLKNQQLSKVISKSKVQTASGSGLRNGCDTVRPENADKDEKLPISISAASNNIKIVRPRVKVEKTTPSPSHSPQMKAITPSLFQVPLPSVDKGPQIIHLNTKSSNFNRKMNIAYEA